MKNKLFIFIFLSSINFTQADTSATPKLAAAPEEKIHCKDAQEYRENIKRAMYCEKIWLLILAAKKHSDYISPENLAKLHEHFTTFKCNDFPNLLQDISEVEYAREKIRMRFIFLHRYRVCTPLPCVWHASPAHASGWRRAWHSYDYLQLLAS